MWIRHGEKGEVENTHGRKEILFPGSSPSFSPKFAYDLDHAPRRRDILNKGSTCWREKKRDPRVVPAGCAHSLSRKGNGFETNEIFKNFFRIHRSVRDASRTGSWKLFPNGSGSLRSADFRPFVGLSLYARVKNAPTQRP